MTGRGQQLTFDLPHRQALGRDDFLVTASNAAAVELIDQWPNWVSYGALLVGPPGSGKSHLVEVWRQRTGAQCYRVEALEFEAIPQLLQAKTLVLEVEAAFDQRALFHMLNAANQQNCHLLLTAQMPPPKWNIHIPDLLSRLNALPLVAILPPNDELLRGVLVKLFADRQILVDESTLTYMLLRMPRSLQSARDIVAEIDAQAMSEKAEITRPFVTRVLSGFTNPDMFES